MGVLYLHGRVEIDFAYATLAWGRSQRPLYLFMNSAALENRE